jgi:UDP-2-acetamido-2,6-beta-L-arabino-hexul-4-ose reductase
LKKLDAPSFIDLFEPEFAEDDRGRLLTPVSDEDLAASRVFHVHSVTCRPGAIRGNHAHPHRTETACLVSGAFLIRCKEVATDQLYEVQTSLEAPRLIVLRPGVAHAFQNIGRELGVLLCWADEAYDPADIQPVRLI